MSQVSFTQYDLDREPPAPAALAAAIAALRAGFGERCVHSEAMRRHHAHSVTWHDPQLPDAVVFAASTEEVAAVVRICAEHDVPIVPFGTGTSIEGHVNAPFGGISLDLSQMDRILSVSPEDASCVVEAGVTRVALNEHLRSYGLFFPVDPGANASLGGMAATRASGTTTVRYGAMRENVLAVKAVVADGSVVHAGRPVRKSASGYDLSHLFVGSEGTLGVITEVSLRLHPAPEAVVAGSCAFPDIAAACNAAIYALQLGIPLARVELLDTQQIVACNRHAKLALPEAPHLFVELHGSEHSVAEQRQQFEQAAGEMGAAHFAWATKAEERSRLWTARHNVYFANLAYRPGARAITTDLCVPLSRLADVMARNRERIGAADLVAMTVGHVGDGNVHVQFLVDFDDADERRRAFAVIEQMTYDALEAGGTCTGEHGIGQGKTMYMVPEHGVAAVAMMRALKLAVDPQRIFNPGKIFPARQ